jgi:hypothetical protein
MIINEEELNEVRLFSRNIARMMTMN